MLRGAPHARRPDALSCSFHNVVRGSNPYMRAYRYITLTTPDKPNFQENAAAAYMSLDGRSGVCSVCARALQVVSCCAVC